MSFVTNITPPREPIVDQRTGLISRAWYKFFLYLFNSVGAGSGGTTIVDLAVSPSVKVNPSTASISSLLVSSTNRYSIVKDILSTQPINKQPPSLFGNGNTLRQKRINVDLNSANTDVSTITNLPSKYWITGFRIYDTSTNLASSLATIGVYTGPGATGTTIVTPATLTSLTSANNVSQMTIATSNYQTAPILYIRNVVANGSAATVTAQIEVIDLS